MHLGYVDAGGRLYDLNFRTAKRRLVDAEGDWIVEEGEALGPPVPLEAGLFLDAPAPHLLLSATPGTVRSSARRLVFRAGDAVPRSEEEPSAFRVRVAVPTGAVAHLLREGGGREVLEVRREEFVDVLEARGDVTARVRAPWIRGEGAFRLVLRPRVPARTALSPLRL